VIVDGVRYMVRYQLIGDAAVFPSVFAGRAA
jgi:hypothetical protein